MKSPGIQVPGADVARGSFETKTKERPYISRIPGTSSFRAGRRARYELRLPSGGSTCEPGSTMLHNFPRKNRNAGMFRWRTSRELKKNTRQLWCAGGHGGLPIFPKDQDPDL